MWGEEHRFHLWMAVWIDMGIMGNLRGRLKLVLWGLFKPVRPATSQCNPEASALERKWKKAKSKSLGPDTTTVHLSGPHACVSLLLWMSFPLLSTQQRHTESFADTVFLVFVFHKLEICGNPAMRKSILFFGFFLPAALFLIEECTLCLRHNAIVHLTAYSRLWT